LYTYIMDIDPGSVGGNSPARFGALRSDRAGRLVGGGIRGSRTRGAVPDIPLPENWEVALAYPVSDIELPVGFAVREVPDANGLVLVNHRGWTLYAFIGKLGRKHVASEVN